MQVILLIASIAFLIATGAPYAWTILWCILGAGVLTLVMAAISGISSACNEDGAAVLSAVVAALTGVALALTMIGAMIYAIAHALLYYGVIPS